MGMSLEGHLAYFGLDDSAGTVRNISPYINKIDFEQDNDVHDNTTFGAVGHTFQTGLTTGKITLSGMWDKTALVGTNTVIDGLIGALGVTFSFEYGPEGNSTGKLKKNGECVLASYAESAPVADLVTFTANLTISGAVTKGTFS